MKKIHKFLYIFLCSVIGCMTSFQLFAQTDNQLNYVRKTIVRKPVADANELQALTSGEKSVTTQFYDTWGRNLQTVQHEASASKKDVVQPYYYDALSRPAIQYLPYSIEGVEGSRYRSNAIPEGIPVAAPNYSEQNWFYVINNPIADPTPPYIAVQYDNSPLNQVLGQSKLGVEGAYTQYWNPNNPWFVNQTKQQYSRSNSTTYYGGVWMGDDKVRKWNFDTQNMTFDGIVFCAEQTLLMTDSRDDGLRSESFTDARGRAILQRQHHKYTAGSTTLLATIETYSIYNDLDQLVAVIQPEGMKELATRPLTNESERWKFVWGDDFCKKYVFLYEYDEQGRMIAKTVPAKERQRFFYDVLGRVIASQETKIVVAPRDGEAQEQPEQSEYIWAYKKYDSWGREIMSGIFQATEAEINEKYQNGANYQLFETKLSSLSTSKMPYSDDAAFPKIGEFTNQTVLQFAYYDDYSPAGMSKTAQSLLILPQNPLFDATLLQTDSRIKGKMTISGVKILDKTNRSNDWDFSISLYDEYGHSLQTQNYVADQNKMWDFYVNGVKENNRYDISTTQYDAYKGQVQYSELQHRFNENSGKSLITVFNRFLYDHAGRLTHTYQQHIIEGVPEPEVLVTKNTYNEVEKNIKTQLHSQNLAPDAPASDFVQSMDYRYTLAGQIAAINDIGLFDEATDLFGMEYDYNGLNYPAWAVGSDGGTSNGMITHNSWKSKRDMHIKGFYYGDNQRYNNILGRVEGAYFAYKSDPTKAKEFETSYDLNGNIKTMKRSKNASLWGGMPISLNDQIDNLTYHYNGNKLIKVDEAALPFYRNYMPGSGANDFRKRSLRRPLPDGSIINLPAQTNLDEYIYDDNGNLIEDWNKGIKLSYNHLQLPDDITFIEDNSKIQFTYNAAGERQSQVSPNMRTDYVNGFLYENGILKSFGLPNGRMVNVKQADNSYKLEYEYHYTDHIGNLRLAFRVKTQNQKYELTAEDSKYDAESKTFEPNYTTNVQTDFDAHSGRKSVFLNNIGRGSTSRIYKDINIGAGSVLKMKVWAKVAPPVRGGRMEENVLSETPPPAPPNQAPPNPPLLGGLTKTSPSGVGVLLPLLSVATEQIAGTETKTINFNFFGLVPLVKKLLSPKSPTPTLRNVAPPKGEGVDLITSKTPPSGGGGLSDVGISPDANFIQAGLSYQVQDNNGNFSADMVNVSLSPVRTENGWQLLEIEQRIGIDGVLTAQIFNFQQGVTVLFDDWTIEVIAPSNIEIVQEIHYDPWGLPMQEECFSTPNDTDFSFNGKELQTFADLYLYDYHWRQYDPQLGRWHNVDPSADSYHGLSPYNYCFNNPVMVIDPDGREPIALAFVVAAAWTAFKVGAVTSAIMYTATHTSNFNVQHFLESTIAGGLISAATAGLDLGSSYVGLALLGKTTGLTRGLLGLGYQMASTAATSVIGNVLAGRQWDSNFNIGVGAFTIPFRNGNFSLNPLDHINNIVTIRQHYLAIRAAYKGFGKITFDLQSFRMTLTTKKYFRNVDNDVEVKYGLHKEGVTYINSEDAISDYYQRRYDDIDRQIMGDDIEKMRLDALAELKTTQFHEGVHAFQSGLVGTYTWRKSNQCFLKMNPNVEYKKWPWEKIAFRLEDKIKGK